jgi:hypothetical protein
LDFVDPESACHAAPLGQNSGMMAFLLGQCANAIRKTERVGKPCDNPSRINYLTYRLPNQALINAQTSIHLHRFGHAMWIWRSHPPARVESDLPARDVCGLDDGFESADINEAVSRRSEGRASRARVVVHSDGEECDFRAPCWRHQLRPAGTDSSPRSERASRRPLDGDFVRKDQKPRNLVGGVAWRIRAAIREDKMEVPGELSLDSQEGLAWP